MTCLHLLVFNIKKRNKFQIPCIDQKTTSNNVRRMIFIYILRKNNSTYIEYVRKHV